MSDYKIAVQKLLDDFEYYAKKCLFIRTKEGKIEKFIINKAQQYIHTKLQAQLEKTGKVRALILKGRQQGASTYVCARQLWRVQFAFGKRGYILTHESAATKNLFNIAKLYVEREPEIIRPEIGADSANELTFPNLNASYRVGTAGNRAVGRSETIQLFFGSEVAYWSHADEHAKGILQAVPDEKDTEIIMESTANGANGWFYQQCQAALRGEGEYQLIFVPWFWQTEYRKEVQKDVSFKASELALKTMYDLDEEQLMFRRAKIVELSANGADGLLAFKQEYPCSSEEAFLQSDDRNLIPANLVQRAMKSTLKTSFGGVIVGVDPARFGDDRTAIAIRKGRIVMNVSILPSTDLMTLVGAIVRLIKKVKPKMVNVDSCGLGAGVVDRLHELGYECVNGVNAGSRAYESHKYYNRRAEMWAKMKLWLDDEPSKMPEKDEILNDLTAIRYSFDSNGRLQLEKKEDMKRRGIQSPDIGDAVALTFSEYLSAMDFTDEDNDFRYVAIDPIAGI